jgi:hypothetical protein
MKNVTLAVDEKSLKAARIYAAEHDTTVNALVRRFLDDLAAKQVTPEARAEYRERLVEMSKKSEAELGPDWRGARQEIYRDYPPHDEAKAAEARKLLVEMSRRSTAEVGPITWTRDETYER